MSTGRLFEQADRNTVVNLSNGPLAAAFAHSTTPLNRRQPGRPPSHAIASGCAPLPPWVSRPAVEFRLPFSHAGAGAKYKNGMEIALGSGDGFSAPVTRLCREVGPAGVGSPHLPFLGTSKGTVALRTLPRAVAGVAAYLADWHASRAPAVEEIARTRTESRRLLPAVLRMERLPALGAHKRYCSSPHGFIVPRKRIEERYCEIAVKRLEQEVFDFGEPEPVEVQEELAL